MHRNSPEFNRPLVEQRERRRKATFRVTISAGIAIVVAATALLIAQRTRSDPLHEFETVKWQRFVHGNPALELMLPYRFEPHPGQLPGEVFRAFYRTEVPAVSLSITHSARSSQECLQAALGRLGPDARLELQRQQNINGVPAVVSYVRWTAKEGAGVSLRTMLLAVRQGPQCIVVSGTDGAPETGFDERLAQAVLSLRLNAGA